MFNLNLPPVPEKTPPWGNRASRVLGCIFLWLLGWQFKGEIPNLSKMILIAAPHTSAWDLAVGLFAILGIGLKVEWLGKAELVNGRLGWLFKRLGGVPINRRAAHGVVAQTAVQFRERSHLLLALAPEGTRGKVKRWKLGFYHMAQAANVPIVPVALDYGRRCIDIGPAIDAKDDVEAVLTQIAQFYEGVLGKNHEKASITLADMLGN